MSPPHLKNDMAARIYDLPAFSALSAFEAAARHLSFKQAAQELNVTPGAVSHQIRALEADLGKSLFERRHRGVELTEHGQALFQTLREAFQDIAMRVESIRSQLTGDRVTIGATTAMSQLWLTPALSRFWRSYADVQVNQIVSDTLDFGGARPEFIMSYGPLETTYYSGTAMFRDNLMPVCAPGLVPENAPLSIQDLAGFPLIHLDAPDKRWTTWRSWFSEMGYGGPLRRGITVNNYMIALQAAQDGAGMVLGWHKMVTPLLVSGALKALDQFMMAAPTSFFLSRRQERDDRETVNALEHWLLSEANLT